MSGLMGIPEGLSFPSGTAAVRVFACELPRNQPIPGTQVHKAKKGKPQKARPSLPEKPQRTGTAW